MFYAIITHITYLPCVKETYAKHRESLQKPDDLFHSKLSLKAKHAVFMYCIVSHKTTQLTGKNGCMHNSEEKWMHA